MAAAITGSSAVSESPIVSPALDGLDCRASVVVQTAAPARTGSGRQAALTCRLRLHNVQCLRRGALGLRDAPPTIDPDKPSRPTPGVASVAAVPHPSRVVATPGACPLPDGRADGRRDARKPGTTRAIHVRQPTANVGQRRSLTANPGTIPVDNRGNLTRQNTRSIEVARGGVEPPTSRFSGGRSYQLSYLAVR